MTYTFNIGPYDYYVREDPKLPEHIRGATMDDEDGNHNIYIRPGMSEEQKLRTIKHEVEHNERAHISDDTKTVAEKEEEIKASDRGND